MTQDAAAPRRMLPTGRLVPDDLDEGLIGQVVDMFYARVREDEVLWPVFDTAIAEADWPRHLQTMRDFWSSMLLGTGRYEGRPMPRHMALPGLATEHFAHWLNLFGEVVTELCPPEVAALFINRAERVAQSFRIGLAFHRGEDSTSIAPLRVNNEE